MSDQELDQWITQNGKCCICETPLKDSKHINMVMLPKKAKWKYPIWGNILAKEETAMGYACGVVCDNCVNEKTGQIKNPIKYAIEIQGGERIDSPKRFYTKRFIIYHNIKDLEDGQPEVKDKAWLDDRPIDNTQRLAEQIRADMQRDYLLAATMNVVDDHGFPEAEEINENMLRKSKFYLMLINKDYIKGIQNPNDRQHHDLIRQLEVAHETHKPTVIIYDETITDEDKEFIENLTRNLDIRKTIQHDFRDNSDLDDKIRDIVESFEDV